MSSGANHSTSIRVVGVATSRVGDESSSSGLAPTAASVCGPGRGAETCARARRMFGVRARDWLKSAAFTACDTRPCDTSLVSAELHTGGHESSE